MVPLDRRQALAGAALLGGTAWGAPAGADECPATYPETAGEELAPGVREVFLTRQDVELAAYKVLWMTDLIIRPGAGTPADTVANDMVVQLLQGFLRVRLDRQEIFLKQGSLWAFPKGGTVAYANTGADVAVMRVIDLLPGLRPS